MCQKDVWTEKLLVVDFNLATPGRKNPPGTCSLWQKYLRTNQSWMFLHQGDVANDNNDDDDTFVGCDVIFWRFVLCTNVTE